MTPELGQVARDDPRVPALSKLRRFVQIIGDLAPQGFEPLRILDLGCLEGMQALELAKQGATVVGIEGREANIAGARANGEKLGISHVEFIQDDVRHLSVERYGLFDVVPMCRHPLSLQTDCFGELLADDRERSKPYGK